MFQQISSTQNAHVKTWKKLLTAKGRRKEGYYLIEGWHLVQEALLNHMLVYAIVCQSVLETYAEQLAQQQVYVVTPEISQLLSETVTSQSIFGVVSLPNDSLDLTEGKYVLVDAVQDPGNLGTIIRTADAAGFTGVILGEGCVDVYNSKTVRSMQGSQFHLPIIRKPLLEAMEELKHYHVPIYASALHEDATVLSHVTVTDSCAIIIGNEGNGVSEDIQEAADKRVIIPMPGNAESLNVAVAAGILMYHFVQ